MQNWSYLKKAPKIRSSWLNSSLKTYLKTKMAYEKFRAVVKLMRIWRLVPGSVSMSAELNLLQLTDSKMLVDFFLLRRFGLGFAEKIQVKLRAADAIELRLAKIRTGWLFGRRRELAIENTPVAPSLVQKFCEDQMRTGRIRSKDNTFVIVWIVEALEARAVSVDPFAKLLGIIRFSDNVVIQWTRFDEKMTLAFARNVELRVAAFDGACSVRN
jgi:hypothetical protein